MGVKKLFVAMTAAAVAVVGLSACTEPPGPAPGRYVSTTGTDAGTCATPSTACATVTYAVGQATTGQTVFVSAGTYPELVIVDKALTFKGANAGVNAGVSAVVSPAARGPESKVKGFRTPGEPHPNATGNFDVTVDGFAIDPQGDAALIAPNTHHLVGLFGGNNVKVINNAFDGGPWAPDCESTCTTMTDAAVMIRSGTYEVKNNSFTNFRSPMDVDQDSAAHPVVSGTISANRFTHVTNRAIWISEYPGGPLPGTITVSGNQFDATGWTGSSYPAGLVITAGGNTIANNTFTGFSSAVFLQVCDGTNVAGDTNTFTNNSFIDNRSGLQFFVAAPCAGTTVPATITNNRFDGGTWSGPGSLAKIGVRWNEVGGTRPNDLVAECNWWGSAAGANTAGASTTTAGVDADPWNITPVGSCTGTAGI